MSRFTRGLLSTLVGAMLWGFSGACAQYLYAHSDIEPLFLTVVRMLGAGVLFLAYFAARHRDALRDLAHDRESLRSLTIFGCLGLYLCQVTYTIVVSYTNAGTATVLQSSSVVLVMLVTCVAARRLPRARELAGLACALVATVLIATGGDLGTLHIPAAGLAWGIANAVSVTFYIMYPKRLFSQWGAFFVTGLGMLIGGVMALVVWLGAGAVFGATGGAAGVALTIPALDGGCLLALAGIVILGTAAAFGLYLNGVSIVGGMRGSLLGTMEPVSATLFSALALGTTFLWSDWVGLVLMMATTALVATGGKTEE